MLWTRKRLELIAPAFFALLLILNLSSAAFGAPGEEIENVASETKLSRDQYFMVTYETEKPVPLFKTHNWRLTVKTPDGRAVEDAKIVVGAEMPQHGHGLFVIPSVKNLGKGEYLVEGMKFHMAGAWIVYIDIDAEGHKDRVEFDLYLY